VAAFTVGVTAARFEACKRGFAANYAAILARHEMPSVCVVDADPRSCDIGTRLAVHGPAMRRFADKYVAGPTPTPARRALCHLAYPSLHVLPVEPGYVDVDYLRAYNAAMAAVRNEFDVVVVDLPVGAGRPGPTLDQRVVDHVDVLVLAVTPGFGVRARWIVHTVGPVWHGGGDGEAGALASCYRRSLEVARDAGARSIAFPAISTGIFGFPKDLAARIAVATLREAGASEAGAGIAVARLVAFDRETYDLYCDELAS
jgi:hypothetical protein